MYRRREKTSVSERDICFFGADNEQMSDEIGQGARKRGFASLRKIEEGDDVWKK